MNKLRLTLLAMWIALPLAAAAAVSTNDLPGSTIWYLHADLKAMRDTESGSSVYAWFEDEVIEEVSEQFGIDVNEEFDSITAFTDAEFGTVVVVDGPLSQDTKDKLLAFASTEEKVDPREFKGKRYFHIGDDESRANRGDEPFDDLSDSAFFSFDLKNRAIITGNEAQMKALLDNGGKITGGGSHAGALFVISAEKSFVQAGLRTDELSGGGDDGWESNILRNTEQAALVVSDASGMIAVEAQLISTDPKMARAIGGIINGLIALQAFNSELGPEIQGLIQNTRIEVNESRLSINTVIDPDLLVSVLGD